MWSGHKSLRCLIRHPRGDTKRIWNESLKFRERLRLETQIYESLAQTAIWLESTESEVKREKKFKNFALKHFNIYRSVSTKDSAKTEENQPAEEEEVMKFSVSRRRKVTNSRRMSHKAYRSLDLKTWRLLMRWQELLWWNGGDKGLMKKRISGWEK